MTMQNMTVQNTKDQNQAMRSRPGRGQDEAPRSQNVSATEASQPRIVTPAVDIYGTQDEVLLVADLPGVRSEDLGIEFANDTLTVRGERKAEGQAPQARPVVFQRSFVVPKGIDAAAITAELKDGVLRVHLPKHESLKPRQIQVRAG